MRSFQVFASMAPDRATEMMRALSEKAPGVFQEAVHAAGAALKARPVYLQRLPLDRRANAVRRALSRVAADGVAGEVLAVYFLECRKPLLVEWLDLLGLAHEDGVLEDEAPSPPDDALRRSVEKFRAADGDPDRELLLKAFAAQASIDWPALDALLDGGS